MTQKVKIKNKLHALHAPEVECITKGKVCNPYEFGVKVCNDPAESAQLSR
jgi:IS5 family transposase